MTLTDFLLARIAEDEAAVEAKWLRAPKGAPIVPDAAHTRVLAECEAKRRIVEYCPSASEEGDTWDTAFWRVLQILALPYADHPDYREEWKP
jgi:hypothetical protein